MTGGLDNAGPAAEFFPTIDALNICPIEEDPVELDGGGLTKTPGSNDGVKDCTVGAPKLLTWANGGATKLEDVGG